MMTNVIMIMKINKSISFVPDYENKSRTNGSGNK